METKSVSGKQMETNDSGGNEGRKKEWLRRQKEAFRSQLRVMPSFVSRPLGPIYVHMSRVARDAFNTAASDDTDLMRQTDRRTDGRTDGRTGRRKGKGGRHFTEDAAEANCIWTPPHAPSPGGRPLQYSGLSLLCQIQ